MRKKDIEGLIDAVCERGCRHVLDYIEALERGETLPETHGLHTEEIHHLLGELKSVMAIYGNRCRITSQDRN